MTTAVKSTPIPTRSRAHQTTTCDCGEITDLGKSHTTLVHHPAVGGASKHTQTRCLEITEADMRAAGYDGTSESLRVLFSHHDDGR